MTEEELYTSEDILKMIDEAPDIDRVGEYLRDRLTQGKAW